jgi:NAD(P)-dependent dehydrogenase (short-subunit alcohol dehydrogenase family)
MSAHADDPDAPGSQHHAFVTGAGRGIGRGIALSLAADGYAVTGISRSASDLDELSEVALETLGARVRTAVCDVRDTEQLEALIGSAGADVLVTAAGINRPGPLTEVSVPDILAVVEINVIGTLLACRAFGRASIAAGRPGKVVTISSQMGVVGYPGRVPYCASKHAVNGLTKALALEWASHGIRVNAVAPTFVRTPFTEPMFADPQFEREVLDLIPLGQIAEVEDVTAAIRFLLSPGARMITGHVLAVDGGWTVR